MERTTLRGTWRRWLSALALACGATLAGVGAGAGEDAPAWVLSIDGLPNFHYLGEELRLPLAVFDARDPIPPDPNPAVRRDRRGPMLPGGPRGEPARLRIYRRWLGEADEAPAAPGPGDASVAAILAMPYGRERPTSVWLRLDADELVGADADSRFNGRVKTLLLALRLEPSGPSATSPGKSDKTNEANGADARGRSAGGELVATAMIHLWNLGRRLAPPPENGPVSGADEMEARMAPFRFVAGLSPLIDRFGRFADAPSGLKGTTIPDRVIWLVPRRSEGESRRWQSLRLIRDGFSPAAPRAWALAARADADYIAPPCLRLPRLPVGGDPADGHSPDTPGAPGASASGVSGVPDEFRSSEPYRLSGSFQSWREGEHRAPPVFGLFRQALLWRLSQEIHPDDSPWAHGTVVVFPGGGDPRFGTAPDEYALALRATLAAFEYAPRPPRRLILATPPPLPGHEAARGVYDRAAARVARERFAVLCRLVPEADAAGANAVIDVGDSTVRPSAALPASAPAGGMEECSGGDVSVLSPLLAAAHGGRGADEKDKVKEEVRRRLADSLENPHGLWIALLAASPLALMALASFSVTWLWRRARWNRRAR